MNNRTTPLFRPDEGRWLAGVAAGLALRLEVSPWIVRIGFALLCFAGGLGAILYVAGWLLIPAEGETESIIQNWSGNGQARQWLGMILVAVAVMILAGQTWFIRGDLAFAVVLIGIGVMLYRGYLRFGDRRRTPASSSGQVAAAASSPAVPGGGEREPPAGDPPAAPTPPPPREVSFLGRAAVGLAVLAVGVLGLLDTAIADFRPDFHHYVALVVGVVALGLVIGAWFGRPGGLVVLGSVLLPILLISRFAGLADFTFTTSVSELHRPGSVEAVRGSYRLDVGELTIDLRRVEFAGRTVELDTEVEIGEIVVRLPADVAAEVRGAVGMGVLRVGDQEHGGIEIERHLTLEGSEGALVLDADIGVGRIAVIPERTDHRSLGQPEADTGNGSAGIHGGRSGSDLYEERSIHRDGVPRLAPAIGSGKDNPITITEEGL